LPFEVSAIPQVLWKCPICNIEEGLKVKTEGLVFKKHWIVCESCGAKWADPSKNDGMTLIQGPAEHLGFRDLNGWYNLANWQIQLAPIGVSVPIIIKKGEAVLKLGRADHFKSKTRRVRSTGSYSGVSFKVAKGVRFSTGGYSSGPAQSVEETVKDDEGEFILTNRRLIFNGNRKPVNMDLKKIIAIDVENGYMEVGYGQKTHLFRFPSESMFKWQAYTLEAIKAFCD